MRRVPGVALLYERRRWLLPLQLAIGVGGQQVRVWAMRPSNDIVFLTARFRYIYIYVRGSNSLSALAATTKVLVPKVINKERNPK